MESLPTKIASIAQHERGRDQDEEEENSTVDDQNNEGENGTTLGQANDDDELMKEMEKIEMNAHRLFEGFHFFLSREVPKNTFEFVICAFGGKVSWDNENEPSITHQIIDRPLSSQAPSFLSRIYVQPQWVADSVNAKFLLPIEEYLPGKALPAHISPFISTPDLTTESSGDNGVEDDTVEQYVPQRQLEINDLIRGIKPGDQNQEQDQEENVEQEPEEDIEEQERNYLKELSKEQGFQLDDNEENEEEERTNKAGRKRKQRSSEKRTGPSALQKMEFDEKQKESFELLQKKKKLEERERKREREELELKQDMLPRKKRALYNKLAKQEQRRKNWVDNLKTKRVLIDLSLIHI
eukprot:TRINITY_DN984_c2_g3_i1.p2 TRINITY_DN984_c2_g3~~TRINITY_DN984_c2_g3_i1.p2  ORF type:complete len:353 (-),score=120.07 TRINITY_DN984_c2_g3_i1:21-1079(-)